MWCARLILSFRIRDEILADLGVVLGYGFNQRKKTLNLYWKVISYRFHFRTEGRVRAFRLVIRQLSYVFPPPANRSPGQVHYSTVVITQVTGTDSDIAFQVYKRVGLSNLPFRIALISMREIADTRRSSSGRVVCSSFKSKRV